MPKTEVEKLRVTSSSQSFGFLLRHEVPGPFREAFIQSGYRKPYISALQSVKSAFQPCNEAINVWTHFIPFILFLLRFTHVFSHISLHDPYFYPLLSFAVGICGFCLMSSGAHLFNCMSIRARHICFYFDYAAISIYSVGAGQAFYFYARAYENNLTILRSYPLFFFFTLAISVFSTVTCCASRHKWRRYKYTFRTLSFVVAFIYNSFPFYHRLFVCSSAIDCNHESVWYFGRHTAFYLIAALANASKLPERLQLGAFDLIGHSHHFLHIFTSLGAADQFTALHLDMMTRQSLMNKRIYGLTTWCTLGTMTLGVVLNVFIVMWFAFKLEPDAMKKDLVCETHDKKLQ